MDMAGDFSELTDSLPPVQEQEQHLAELQAAERKFRSMFEHAPLGIYQTQLDGRCICANPCLARLLGYGSAEEFLQDAVGMDARRYQDPERFRELQQRLHEAGAISGFEAVVFRRDGSTLWTSTSARLVVDPTGEPAYYEGFIEDISDRKQAEQEREATLSLVQATFESTADGLLVVSRQGKVLGYNQKFTHMWNMPPELLTLDADPKGRFQYLANQTADPEGFKARVLELFDQRPNEAVFDRLEMADGRIFERYSQPQWMNGQIVGRVWSYRDITEQQRAETALRQREEKYRAIFENSQVGIGRTDLKTGLILEANQRFCELMGYDTPQDLIGQVHTRQFYRYPGERDRILQELEHHSGIHDFEVQLRRRQGTFLWGLLSLRINRAEACLEFVITDIGERKRLEENLRQSQQFLNKIVENIPLTIFTKNLTTGYRYELINQNCEQILGFSREEGMGKTDYDLLPPELADHFHAQDQEVIAAGTAVEYVEDIVLPRTGRRVYLRGVKLPLYDSQGNPTHLLGIGEDLTERKRWEDALRLMVEGTASSTGAAFFRTCVRYLAEALQVRYAFIAALDSPTQGHTLAYWAEGAIAPNFSYTITGTPCSELAPGKVVTHPRQVRQRFPTSPRLQMMRADSYLGIPLVDSAGQMLGHFVVLDDQPMGDDPGRVAILKIFAARAGAELERMQAETALRQSEERKQAILTAIPDLMSLVRSDGIYLDSVRSNTLADLIPPDAQPYGKHLREILPEDVAQRQLRAIAEIMATGQMCVYEQQVWLHGQLQYEEVRAVPCGDDAVLFLIRNISERKQAENRRRQAEAALQASEERNRAILSAIPDIMALVNQEGIFLDEITTNTFIDLIPPGIPCKGKSLAAMLPPEVSARHQQAIATVLAKREIYIYEQQVQVKGRRQFEEVRAVPCGESAVLFLIRDISDRKRAENLLDCQKQVLEMIAADASLTETLTILIVAFEQLAECKAGSILFLDPEGKRLHHGIAPHLPLDYQRAVDGLEVGPCAGSCGTAVARKAPVIVTDTLVDPCWEKYRHLAIAFDLRSCWSMPILTSQDEVLGTFALYFDRPHAPSAEDWQILETAAHLAGIAIERKRTGEELYRAKEAAEAANRAKSQFLANMSHELRTPMNAILGFTQLMARDDTLSSQQRESLTVINQSGEHLLNLINDVLEMSKIEAGRVTFNPNPFDLYRLVQVLQEMFQGRAHAKSLALQVDIHPAVPQYLATDEGKLRQVLINLLGNSIKFTDQGSITLRISRSEASLAPITLAFAIEDNRAGHCR